MKTRITLFFLIVFAINFYVEAQSVWTGPTITFSKANFADWTQAANQDQITSNVWITTKDNMPIFNIAQESGWSNGCSGKVADTEWAVGTTADLGSLTFSNLTSTNIGGCALGLPSSGLVSQGDMVLHLITDDIYIDIRFTQWTDNNGGGGGFTYERSTDPALSINEIENQSKTFVYPNPSTDYLNISNASLNYEKALIFDITGHKISETSIDSNRIDIRGLSKGIYLLTIANKQPLKFIKN